MAEEDFFIQKPGENALKATVQKYLPYWPLLIIIAAIVFPLFYIYLRAMPRVYVAAAKALIKDPYKSPSENKALEALNIFNEKKVIENEIVVMQSSAIMNDVVQHLGLYARVFNKGKVRTEELYKDRAPVYFRAADSTNINYTGTHMLDVDWTSKCILLDGKKTNFNDYVSLGSCRYKVVPNEGYTKFMKGKNYLVSFATVPSSSAEILQSLSISANSYQSSVINLDLKTNVPEKGKDILNTLLDVYNKNGLKDKNKVAGNTLKFIEDRLLDVSHQLDSIETNIKNLKSGHGIVDLGSQAAQYLDAVKTYEQKGSELHMQLDAITNLEGYVAQKGDKSGIVPGLELINDPMLSSLSTQLHQAEFDLEKQQSVAGEQSEAVQLARQKVARLRNDIRENIRNIKRNIQDQTANVSSNIAKNNSLLSQVPANELSLLETKRQQLVKNTIYNYLLQKREETALSSIATTGDLRVLEAGYSYGPISPKTSNYYLLAALLSIGIFVLTIYLKEHLNNRILFRSTIEKELSLPIAGEISFTKDKRPIVSGKGEHTIIAEQFRSLRTNLHFLGLNVEKKGLSVSSCISGEGKSFISANIAATLALTGKSVALLELDLRKPGLSKNLNVSSRPGITDFIMGNASLQEIIKTIESGLFSLVSSGTIPPNPAELLMHEKFETLVNELKERFDFVIFDTPPVGLVTDAIVISKYADVHVFVVRHNYTPESCLKLIKELNKFDRIKNISIVFNGIKPRGFRWMRKQLGSGYGSSYGLEQNSAYGKKNGYYTTE